MHAGKAVKNFGQMRLVSGGLLGAKIVPQRFLGPVELAIDFFTSARISVRNCSRSPRPS
jgi:hypothetical protein